MNRRHTLICVSVGLPELADSVALAAAESRCAEVIEIRLDCLRQPLLEPFFDSVKRPLLFTNRPDWEGGRFDGSEADRLTLLEQALAAGAAYVDCEFRAPPASRQRLRRAADNSGGKLILSWHDFSATPPPAELHRLVSEMREGGADIGKIVTTADDHLDVIRVLNLQSVAAELNFPLIAFCMGRAGTISRLATLELGGYMTYCAPAGHRGTAPGQIGCAEMRRALAILREGGEQEVK